MSLRDTLKPYFYFDTIKLVTVHSWKLGVFHRLVQILAVLYIVIYSIYFKMGYQEYSHVSGIIYSKAKGMGFTNDSINGIQIYDSNDLVYPPIESDALFLTAGFIKTEQQRDICDSTIKCNTSADCEPALTALGEILGDCDTSTGYCSLQGWCPLENDKTSAIMSLTGVETVTVFMRSSVNYELFDVSLSDPADPIKSVNLFTIQQIIGNRNISDCATSGCIVAVQVDWTCNFNIETCGPKISFSEITGGFNFRKVNYELGLVSRELEKLYGIRMVMRITGQGGRFSIFQTVITAGSGAAFIALSTLITDFILLFLFNREDSFTRKKYGHIKFKTEST